jgi:hypothetical protein
MTTQAMPGMESLFDRQQREFPSHAHRVAWFLGASLLPFAPVIPPGLSQAEAQDLALGEQSLHAFLSALYADMYRHPGAYLMTEAPDLVFNDGEWYKDRPDMTRVRGRNAHVLKSLEVLFELGCRAALDGDTLVLDAGEYDRVFAEIRPASISKTKVRGFLAALEQFGLEISAGPGKNVMRSTQYPKLLLALKALCRVAGAEDLPFRFFAFHRCDFKAVEQSYAPDVTQVLSVLPQDTRAQAEGTIAAMLAAGYKMELQMGGYPNAIWMVKFSGSKKYKASNFFWFGFSIEYLNRFYVELHCINPQHLIPVVYRKGDEWAAWFDRTWNHDCNGCGSCQDKFKVPGPYLLEVNGKKRGLCHQCWLGARNPTGEQMENLLKMVSLHTEAGMVG